MVESVRGVGGGYRFAGNARRLTLMDVIRMFEELSAPDGERREPGEETPVGRALSVVLAEIDEIAAATFSSITIATMLRLLDRQQRDGALRPPRAARNRRRGVRRETPGPERLRDAGQPRARLASASRSTMRTRSRPRSTQPRSSKLRSSRETISRTLPSSSASA